MFSLVYVSSATRPFSTPEMIELLEKSRRNNAKLGVTGMLLYKDGNIMQVLEGEESVVRGLAARIGRDPRHRGVMELVQGPQEGRHFADWSMGFRDLRSAEAAACPGYSPFLNTPLDGPEFAADPSRCHRLLLCFKKSM